MKNKTGNILLGKLEAFIMKPFKSFVFDVGKTLLSITKIFTN